MLNYLNVWPYGQVMGTSTLNSTDGKVKSNAAITAAGTGKISAYASEDTDLILDVEGYFVPTGTAGSSTYHPITACRAVTGGAVTATTVATFPLAGTSGCPSLPKGATAYALNLTVTTPINVLHAAAGGTTPGMATATLNGYEPGATANAAFVMAGSDPGGSISVSASGSGSLIVDVEGYFTADNTGLAYFPVAPCRVAAFQGNFINNQAFSIGGTGCAAPATAGAYAINATAIPQAGQIGFLDVWADPGSEPPTSVLNASEGVVTSNLVISPNTDGTLDAHSANLVSLIMDLSGFFAGDETCTAAAAGGGGVVAGNGTWQCWTTGNVGTFLTPNLGIYGIPYWNGDSGDGNTSNIGYVLSGGRQDVFPYNLGTPGYFGQPGGGSSSNIYFTNTGTVTLTLLQQMTAGNVAPFATVGWYPVADPNNPTAPATADMHIVLGDLNNLDSPPNPQAYPFYMTPLPVYGKWTFSPTPYYGLFFSTWERGNNIAPRGTFFSQSQFNQGEPTTPDTTQHFAVFQQSASSYVIGMEDEYSSSSDFDYNDAIIQLSTVAPAVTLTPTNITFANQAQYTQSATQIVTFTNTASSALTFVGAPSIYGGNPNDFSQPNSDFAVSITAPDTCMGTLAAGASCSVGVTFTPQATGSRGANLIFRDNAAGSLLQAVYLSGSGTAAPSGFTTYLGPYGSASQVVGNSAKLHLVAYDPGGASQVTQLQTYFDNSTTGAQEYLVLAEKNTTGGYFLYLQNASGTQPPYPYQTITPNGILTTLTPAIALGNMQYALRRRGLTGIDVGHDADVPATF